MEHNLVCTPKIFILVVIPPYSPLEKRGFLKGKEKVEVFRPLLQFKYLA